MSVNKILKNISPVLILIIFTLANSIPDIYIPFLRNSYANRFPEKWEKEPNNGKYSQLVVVGPGTGSWSEDEVRAASKVVEFLRNGKPYDLYPKESKYNIYWLQDFISFGILAVIQKVIGNITKTWIIVKILFTFLWLILIYIICREFKLPKLYLIFCSVFTFFFSSMFFSIYFNFPNFYLMIVKSINTLFLIDFSELPSSYSRLPNPLLSYSFIFITIILLMKFFLPENTNEGSNTKINYFRSILFGMFLGLIAYIHPFEWSFSICMVFIIMLLLWYYKYKKLSLSIFICLITSLIISLPLILLHLFSKTSFESYAVIYTRMPDYKSIIFLVIIFFIFYLYKKTNLLSYKQFLLFLSIVISAFVFQNLQILTKLSIQREHWTFISGFFVVLFCLIFIGNLFNKKILKIDFNLLSIMLIIISLIFVINKDLTFSKNNYKIMGLPRSYEKVFSWLKQNTSKNSVIGTINIEFLDLLPLYTENIPYVAVNFPYTHITLRENLIRFKDLLEIMKVDEKKLMNQLKIWDLNYISRYVHNYLHKFLLLQEVSRDDYNIKSFGYIIIGGSYKQIAQNQIKINEINDEIFNLNKGLKNEKISRYELSYLLIDNWTEQFLTEEFNYPLLYNSDGIKIYELREGH